MKKGKPKKKKKKKGFLWSLRVVCFWNQKCCFCLLAKYFSYWFITLLLFYLPRTWVIFFLDYVQRPLFFILVHSFLQFVSIDSVIQCSSKIVESLKLYLDCLMFLKTHIYFKKSKMYLEGHDESLNISLGILVIFPFQWENLASWVVGILQRHLTYLQ